MQLKIREYQIHFAFFHLFFILFVTSHTINNIIYRKILFLIKFYSIISIIQLKYALFLSLSFSVTLLRNTYFFIYINITQNLEKNSLYWIPNQTFNSTFNYRWFVILLIMSRINTEKLITFSQRQNALTKKYWWYQHYLIWNNRMSVNTHSQHTRNFI